MVEFGRRMGLCFVGGNLKNIQINIDNLYKVSYNLILYYIVS